MRRGILILGICACGSSPATPSTGSATSATTATTATTAAVGTTAAALTTTSASASTNAEPGSSSGDTRPPETFPPELDCGTPTFPAKTTLRRFPYLQSIRGTEATIAWTTTSIAPKEEPVGTIRVAPAADGPWTDVPTTSSLFTTKVTLDTEDYFSYAGTVTDLEPNQAYCYEIVEGDTVLATGLKFFTAWDEPTRAVRLIAFGDSGDLSKEQLGLRDVMLGRDFDMFLHLGDMAYGEGKHVEFEERVFSVYRDVLQQVPTYPAIGNHEYKTNNGQPYIDSYSLWPVALNPVDNERYYSFDYGDVHFVSIDSNPEIGLPIITDEENLITDDMMDWLVADLAASDKPWKIAFFHHPPYSSSDRPPQVLIRGFLVPLLEDGGVDIVLTGHDHHYERTVAIRGGAATPHEDGGIYYFVAGAGGGGAREAFGDWFTEAYADQEPSFLELNIRGCIATGQAIGLSGAVLDEFELRGCDD